MGRKRVRTGKYLHLCVAGLILLCISGCATLKEREAQSAVREELALAHTLLTHGDFEGALEANEQVLSEFRDRPPGDEALLNMGIIFAHHANPRRDYEKSLELFKKLLRDFPGSALAEEVKVWVGLLYLFEDAETRLAEAGAQLKDEGERLQEAQLKLEELQAKLEEARSKKDEKGTASEYPLKAHKLLAQGNYDGSLDESQRLLARYGSRPPGDTALFTIGLIYAHPDNPKKDYKKSLEFFRRVMREFPQSTLFEEAKIWSGVLDVIERTKQVDIEIEQKKKELAR